MPARKKRKTSVNKTTKTVEVKSSALSKEQQQFFESVDQLLLDSPFLKGRLEQLEEQEKLCEKLQEKAELTKKSFKGILKVEPDEEAGQEELTQLKELQNQITFYLELEEDLKKLKTPTKELFQALEENHTNQEELILLMQKSNLLRSIKRELDADILFNHVYQILKKQGVGKKTLQNMQKQAKLPRLKTSDKSNPLGDGAQEEEKEWSTLFPFTVLGYNNQHSIKISHQGEIKTISLKDAKNGVLTLYVGTNTEKNNDQLTDILIELAHKEGVVDDQNTIKTGIEYLEKEKKFLVVSGKNFFKVTPENLQIETLKKPVVNGKLIEGDRYKKWITPQQIRKADLKQTFDKVWNHLQQWEWVDANMGKHLAAFIMLYPFHKIINYRPWLYLLGGSQSGKTTLIEGFIMPLYKTLVMKMDKSTAHSTAQEVGNTAIIPIFDEFEKFGRIQEVLELFKMTSSKGGGVKKSGTPGKDPHRFEIKQMPLFASIYTPASIKGDFSQDNRTLLFKLSKSKGFRNPPKLFDKEECEELQGDIISSMMAHWHTLTEAVKKIEKEKEEMVRKLENRISSRTVNNFCYSLALMYTVNPSEEELQIPEWACEDMQRDDGDRVLSDLLHARVSHEGKEHLVLDLIYSATEKHSEEDKQILRKNGMTPATSKGEKHIAFDSKQIKKTVFKQDDYYKKLHIGDVLERLPGAKKNQPTNFGAGDIRRSIQVPFKLIKEVAHGGAVHNVEENSEEKTTENPEDKAPTPPKKKAAEEKPKEKELLSDPLKKYAVTTEYVTTKEQAKKAFKTLLESEKSIALDIETYSKKEEYGKRGGLEPHITEIRLVQCYNGKGPIYVFDLHKTPLKDFPKRFWEMPFVCHNAVFELQHLLSKGIQADKVDCTLLMEHVVIGRSTFAGLSLKNLCKKYLSIDLSKEQQVSDWSAKTLSKEQITYAAIDALVTFELMRKIIPLIRSQKKIYSYKLKRDAQFSVASMKVAGLPINEKKHLALIENWQSQKEESAQKLQEQLGETNPNSSKQLNDWLQTNLDKDTLENWKRTKTGAYQTSGDVLKFYKDKLPWWEAHRDFKKVDKRLNNYGQKMIDLKNPITQRLHSDIAIAGTDTGRLSSSNPNCQNFPREDEFREIFEAPKGKKLIVADYSQVELRVAAIISQDKTMLEAYENGEDLHRKTAAFVAGIKEEEVTKEDRQKAKAVNFGFLFGMGAERFVDYARDSYGVKLTLEDSQKARRRFFDTYQGIKNWHYRARQEVERTQRTQTPMGFVRYFDKQKTELWKIQNEALNTPVQGGAAEATLKALHHIGKALDWTKGQIINCIHDEIIIESNDDYVDKAQDILQKGMVQGFLDVFPKATTKKLVEVGVGKNWVEAK